MDPSSSSNLNHGLRSDGKDPYIRTNPPLTISTRAASRNIDGHVDGDIDDDVECLHPHLQIKLG
jgi:hypothetical protein